MKLQECMQCDYLDDVVEPLISGDITIDAAFAKLTKLRKNENSLVLEEIGRKGVTDEIVTPVDVLEDTEVKQLLEFGNDADFEKTLDNTPIEELDMVHTMEPTEKYQANARTPVDPAIREETFERDNYICVCCKEGGEEYRYVLDYHHKIPYSCGGKDTVENGATVCLTCHQLIHLYAVGELKTDKIRQENIERTKRVMHYGNIIVTAIKKKGASLKDFKKEDNPHFKGRIPYWELAKR